MPIKVTYHSFARYLRRRYSKDDKPNYSSDLENIWTAWERKIYDRYSRLVKHQMIKYIIDNFNLKPEKSFSNTYFKLERGLMLTLESYGSDIYLALSTKYTSGNKLISHTSDCTIIQALTNMMAIMLDLYPENDIIKAEFNQLSFTMMIVYASEDRKKETAVQLTKHGQWTARTTVIESGSVNNPEALIFKK